MTPETRETLEQAMDYCTARANSETMRPGANALDLSEWDDENIVEWVESLARWGRRALALRDVLTPRTCGNCALGDRDRNGIYCQRFADYMPQGDGCIKSWQAREGEGGTR